MKSCFCIISPNIRSEVGKQGLAKVYSADFYRNGSYFPKYAQRQDCGTFSLFLQVHFWGENLSEMMKTYHKLALLKSSQNARYIFAYILCVFWKIRTVSVEIGRIVTVLRKCQECTSLRHTQHFDQHIL